MKNAIKFILFCILSFSVCSCLVFGLQKKNAHIEELYSMRNCDVLVLGSSHAYVNLSGAVIYDNYGIASACIAQGEQQIRMSYYSLKSALRYCKPKVVLFEVYMAAIDDDYGVLPNQYANALLSYPIYSNLDVRIEAISDLKGTNYIDYITGIPIYHNDYKRWYTEETTKEITAGYMNGFLETKPDGMTDHCFSTASVTTRSEIGELSRRALMKTIELCREEKVELIFVVTPYQAPDYHIERLNTVKDLAEENGIVFLDMNNYVDDISIDLENDMYDWGHAQKIGEEKNSIWLAKWLAENCDVEDRRGDADYSYWELVSQERKKWESNN